MSQSIKEHILCEFCDGTTETKYVSYTFKRFGQEFAYENIKAEVCPKCSAEYLDGSRVLEIENDIESKVSLKAA